jgi:pimeloyl-ACP methyl ester carboxylesterase
MAFATVNGTTLYYEERGKGLPLLFVHGRYGNHACWYEQVAYFSRRYRVITLDLRGYGMSPDPAGLGPAAFAADLLAIVDCLRAEKVAIVAQSLGGNACLEFAVKHPERVTALIMAGTVGGVSTGERAATARNGSAPAPDSLLDRMFSRTFLEQQSGKAQLFMELLSFNSFAGEVAGGASRPEVMTLDTVSELSAKVPMFFLVGERDAVQPRDVVSPFVARLPGARFAMLPGAGHSAYFEQPESFNKELESFLASVLA